MEEKTPYLLCRDKLNKNGYKNYETYYILERKENGNHHYFALVGDTHDPDLMISLEFDDSGLNHIADVPWWEFFVDYCLLDKLEEKYEIVYMSIAAHYNVWCMIDEWRDDFKHYDGLQKYLSYCQKIILLKMLCKFI